MEHHKFGNASMSHINEGSDAIQQWVFLTLKLCRVDISAVDCLRSEEEQIQNIINGKSWTMDSDHLITFERPKPEAIDLYPWVIVEGKGRTSHSLYHYKLIARAGFTAATLLGKPMIWGGHWKEEHFDAAHWATHREYR